MLAPIQKREYSTRDLRGLREVAKVPNLIPIFHHGIPSFPLWGVHFVDGAEWAFRYIQDPMISEMRIRSEEDRHGVLAAAFVSACSPF
jgi:hypothetical protein